MRWYYLMRQNDHYTVEEIDNPIQYQFFIKFPDGYQNSFLYINTRDIQTVESGVEINLGFTELAKGIGKRLEEYTRDPEAYFEPTEISVGVRLIAHSMGDMEMNYRIYKDNQLLFVLHQGDDNWEADAEVMPELIWYMLCI
jgi:hypothetical protein